MPFSSYLCSSDAFLQHFLEDIGSRSVGKKNAKSKHFAVRSSSLGGRFSVILEAPGAHFGHFGGPGGSFWRLGGSFGPPGPKFENSDQNRLEN